ncbi:DUF417 family protein [Colwellia psychrerythraea]|uniref:DUF417 family protein n=1 Tax=Colwellia psychrerythraea TaxID=28229 RepID=A0A099KVP9_COLPS|nr:DUF417 family protein [Colwellia psychrerythraea]KGJ94626.1 protein of unknown function DUF417 [Colwellia psychrerythraea]
MKTLHLNFTLLLIGISTALLGLSILLLGPHKHITLTTDFYLISDILPAQVFNSIAAFAFISSAVLAFLSIKQHNFRSILGYLLIAISIVPLGSLLSNAMWIASMGGFPVIGSGQGVIKYFALLSIGVLLVKRTFSPLVKAWISILPVLLVLLWIGGMKFTLLEAQGIEGLVKSSPFMGWLYNFFSIQTTSNIIGVYDLIAVVMLILAIYSPKLTVPAILMSGMVFVVTQTFLISFSASLSSETLLSTTGHFLIKDLWFLACLFFYYSAVRKLPSKT